MGSPGVGTWLCHAGELCLVVTASCSSQGSQLLYVLVRG